MSLRPSPIEPVPEETARVARAGFRKGNLLMRSRDELGVLYDDPRFASLYEARGRLAIAPWRLALVTLSPGPAGQTSRDWAETCDRRGTPRVHITFAPATCAACPNRPLCTPSRPGQRRRPRSLVVRLQPEPGASSEWGSSSPGQVGDGTDFALEELSDAGSERAVEDGAADLEPAIGAASRPSHRLGFAPATIDQDVGAAFRSARCRPADRRDGARHR
jgi:hypothetical protein